MARQLWRSKVSRDLMNRILKCVAHHFSQGQDWDLFEKAVLAFHDLLKVTATVTSLNYILLF